nr:MAG TPA: hypothetical protein [Caudoviricetes sp.]
MVTIKNNKFNVKNTFRFIIFLMLSLVTTSQIILYNFERW